MEFFLWQGVICNEKVASKDLSENHAFFVFELVVGVEM